MIFISGTRRLFKTNISYTLCSRSTTYDNLPTLGKSMRIGANCSRDVFAPPTAYVMFRNSHNINRNLVKPVLPRWRTRCLYNDARARRRIFMCIHTRQDIAPNVNSWIILNVTEYYNIIVLKHFFLFDILQNSI